VEPEDVLASDADRDEAVARLRDACGEGRLNLEEVAERAEAAYTARTRSQLRKVLADLPDPVAPSAAPAPERTGPRTKLFALGDDIERGGRWVVDAETAATAVLGDIKLDMREAYFSSDAPVLELRTVFGGIWIWVPAGIGVDLHGSALLGDRSVQIEQPPPGAPVVTVHANTVFGSVRVANNRRRGRILRALLGE